MSRPQRLAENGHEHVREHFLITATCAGTSLRFLISCAPSRKVACRIGATWPDLNEVGAVIQFLCVNSERFASTECARSSAG
jgi:hypothetical protein